MTVADIATLDGMLTFLMIILFALFTILTILLLDIWRTRGKGKKGRSQFYEALDKKFDSGLVNDQSDIEILKRPIERGADTVYSLGPILEDYLVYLGEPGSQESQLSERYQLIKGIITTENADKPFADIPEEERRLLIGMRTAIQHTDKDSMSFNLNELSSVISTRSRDYAGVMKANSLMKPLAVGALAASVFFGILALLY